MIINSKGKNIEVQDNEIVNISYSWGGWQVNRVFPKSPILIDCDERERLLALRIKQK